MSELVVLVDENDMQIGLMPKMAAHVQGHLHRAFSVFIFNTKGEMLLQKRAEEKYHSAGLWSNACCSHPREGETTHDAAVRRLKEEIGITCDVREVFSFVYKAEVENHLIEHEYDHVFIGVTDETPQPDHTEVAEWRYMNKAALLADLKAHPGLYTVWFKLCIRDWHETIFQNKQQQ